MAISGFPENENQGSGAGGFSYGGEWDATANETSRIGEFDLLDNCILSSNQLAVISGSNFGATARNLSNTQNIGTGHKFRVIVPDTSVGFFFVVIHTSVLTPYAAINDETATVRGIGLMSGTPVALIRNSTTFATYPLPYTLNVGDVIRVEYRSDNASVYIYNETQGDILLLSSTYIDGFATVLANLSIFGSNIGPTLSFDFTDDYPIYQALFDFEYPESFSKTYYVSNANENSIINNKLLKIGDFVNFFEDNELVDVVISRLMTEQEIEEVMLSEMSDAESPLSIEIQNLAMTGVLEGLNDSESLVTSSVKNIVLSDIQTEETATNQFIRSLIAELTEVPEYAENDLPLVDSLPVGTKVFNTTYQVEMKSDGTQWIPLSPFTVYAATLADEVTNTTALTLLRTVNIPAKYIGKNGRLSIFLLSPNNGNSNQKTLKLKLWDGTTEWEFLTVSSTTNNKSIMRTVAAAGEKYKFFVGSTFSLSDSSTTTNHTTAVSQQMDINQPTLDLRIYGQLAATVDTMGLTKLNVHIQQGF